MKSERNQLVEPTLASFVEEVMAKIKALETEAHTLSKSIPNASTLRERDKLKEAFREKSAKKIQLAKSLNSEVKTQIRNLNAQISDKLKAEKEFPRVKKAIIKKSKFVRKRTADGLSHRRTFSSQSFYVCLCNKHSDDEIVCCSKELCKIKYFHKQCVLSLMKNGQLEWVCDACR